MPQPTVKPFNAFDAETFTSLNSGEDQAQFLSALECHLNTIEQSLNHLQELASGDENLSLEDATSEFYIG